MITFLRHLFVPHQSNNHRPKLLHHKSLFALILIILILSGWMSVVRTTAPSILGIATNINISDLLAYTNQKRQEEGLPPLVLNNELSQSASAKAADMFAKGYWAHNGPDGTTPWVFFQNAGYNYVYAGENLAKDFNDSFGVISAWLASSSHRENMLSVKYNEVGFAVVNGTLNGSQTTLVVEMLGRRQGSQVAAVTQSSTTTANPPPSPVPEQTSVAIAPEASPTAIPSLTPIPTESPQAVPPSIFAGVRNQPLINSASVVKRLSVAILAFLTLAFISDIIYIERRKIVRLVGHNSDHVLFMIGAIMLVLIFGRGVIL